MKRIIGKIKRKFTIRRLVRNFDFDEHDQYKANNRKEVAENAIKSWYEKLSENQVRSFINVLSKYRYYSSIKTSKTYEKLLNDVEYKEIREVIKGKSAIYMPLKKKENRTETSISMFVNFMNVLGVDSLQTSQENTVKWFENYKNFNEKFKEYAHIEDEYEREIKKCKALSAKKTHDKTVDKSIDRQIEKNKNTATREYESKKREKSKLLKDHKHEFDAKNILIVDDFLCSGTSIITFLKKISPYAIGLDKTIYFIVLEATKEGKLAVENDPIFKKFNNVKIYNLNTAINYEEDILSSKKEVDEFRSNKEELYRKFKLSDDKRYNPKTMLSSFANAPNSNYAFLSLPPKDEAWLTPFPREKRGR